MNRSIRLRPHAAIAAFAVALVFGAAIPGQAPAAAAARRCSSSSQSIRTTHNAHTTTVTIITRRCGYSYRAWLTDSGGRTYRSAWHTAGPGTAYDPHGGNFTGGYQREPTGGGPITTHTSY